MSCILAIYDYETDYANHLMDYIKRKQKVLTQIRVFTNHNSLNEYLEHNQIHILLLGESISVEEILHVNIRNICMLSEGNNMRENIGYPVIYKFQSAELVMQELFSHYPLEVPVGNSYTSGEHKVKIITVFSIACESEQTVISLSLAQHYARHKKTLYINLDIFQVLPELLGRNIEKNLSEFIYFLKQNHPNLITKMNTIITKMDKLDYIQGVTFGPDLYELTTGDIAEWIKELRKSAQYEVIIFDVGCIFLATLELFRESSQLLLLLGENDWEQARYHNFKGQLLWAGFDDVLLKIKVISLSKEEKQRHQNFTAKDLMAEKCGEFIASYVEK